MFKFILRHLKILAVVSFIALGVYYFLRVYFFISVVQGFWDNFFAVLLLLAETYLIIHAVGFVLSVIRLTSKKKLYHFKKIKENEWPSVAVVVAAKNEPKEVLEQTFITLNGLNYLNKKLYFLEDSVDKKFVDQDKKLAKKYNIEFFQPKVLHGAKAGIINDFLAVMEEKYLAVFDADQNPMPDFLEKVVAIAETDPKIAFVQTPQFYSNTEVSPIAKGSAMQQAIFYEAICEAKSNINAMFYCGTNVLFDRKALMSVGGFDEFSITEDFATSIKLHAKGYKSVYYNHVRVFGMAPESLPAYFKQQARWSGGTVDVFRKIMKKFFTNPFSMKIEQWWEYFLSGTYYFIGWAFFILILSPIVFLFFGVPSFFMSPKIYLATYLPYFAMTFFTFYSTMRARNYPLSGIYHGVLLGSLSFPIHMKSTVLGLIGKKMKFVVTTKGKAEQMSWRSLWPWIFMMILCAVAILAGMIQFSAMPIAIAINIFWCCYHLFILGHIFYFNKMPKLEKFKL